ncbi:VOC family protein [Cognaticolwellia beringensis]|uniref:VOC family protein n=1 Tax=Cognaticolwellia beringensis TaxID=1967665 RepID=A0A222G775_9GAMM|nr:VOC family protein [Cognaticolwellia beringensis]ASP47756.1 VOC family protein [Cognaticolwellia beringensis]
MTKNPVGWFEIYVDDLKRARNFYESVFNTSFESIGDPSNEQVEMLAFPANYDVYGAAGALVKMPGFKAGGNSTLIYFSCDDCALEQSKILSSGGVVQRPKMSIGKYGFITLGIDTEGNTFGLHSLK